MENEEKNSEPVNAQRIERRERGCFSRVVLSRGGHLRASMLDGIASQGQTAVGRLLPISKPLPGPVSCGKFGLNGSAAQRVMLLKAVDQEERLFFLVEPGFNSTDETALELVTESICFFKGKRGIRRRLSVSNQPLQTVQGLRKC